VIICGIGDKVKEVVFKFEGVRGMDEDGLEWWEKLRVEELVWVLVESEFFKLGGKWCDGVVHF
jgi:hypothetical protein